MTWATQSASSYVLSVAPTVPQLPDVVEDGHGYGVDVDGEERSVVRGRITVLLAVLPCSLSTLRGRL